MKVAIFGGTGKFGTGLATRVAATSHNLVIASRDAQKAAAAAQGLGPGVLGMSHTDAASWCELAVIATPYAFHANLLDVIKPHVAAKIVIDATVPLDPTNPTRVRTESGMAASQEAADVLTQSRIFAAFHTVSHRVLLHPELSCDVLVAGAEDGKAVVFDFIRSLNLRPIHAGDLSMARLLEATTALLISINKTNKVRESGIQITGI
jgi:8-hydroxy-5-deazaflavin:NADPH oxidoreductase